MVGTYPNQTGGTLLRGYVQTNGPLGANQLPYYAGPIIVAQSNRPVRVKFTNALPTGGRAISSSLQTPASWVQG